MKSIIKVVFFAVALFVASCSSEQEVVQQTDIPSTVGINARVSAPDFVFENGTRTSVDYTGKFSWIAGDKIGIYSNLKGGATQTTSQLMLSLSAGEGTSTAYSTATGWSLIPGGNYNYLSYYPYAETSTREKIVLYYSSQTQTTNNSTAGVTDYDYMYSNAAEPTDARNATFNFNHIGALVNMKITVPDGYEEKSFKKCVLYSEDDILCSSASYSAESVLTNGTPTIENKKYGNITVSFGDTGFTPDDNKVVSVWFMALPGEWKDKTITAKLYTEEESEAASRTIVTASFTPDADTEAGHGYLYSATGTTVEEPVLPAKPADGETLHILLFGHSFGIDCTEYLPAITKAAGVTNVHYGRFYQGDCSMAWHWKHFNENTTTDDSGVNNYTYYNSPAGSTGWSSSSICTSKDILASYPWDIIIFQTNISSSGEGNYDSYKDNFKKLREAAIKICQDKFNKTPYIGWNMFWGYNTNPNYATDYDHNATTEYESIVSATQAMSEDTGIKIIIPTGTTIQNCRNALDSNWGTESAMQCLTRDGYHTTYGIGRYATACTWFQYLIAPIYGVDIKGNTYRPTAKYAEWDVVDDTNVNTIWNCVKAACQSPFAPQQ